MDKPSGSEPEASLGGVVGTLFISFSPLMSLLHKHFNPRDTVLFFIIALFLSV